MYRGERRVSARRVAHEGLGGLTPLRSPVLVLAASQRLEPSSGIRKRLGHPESPNVFGWSGSFADRIPITVALEHHPMCDFVDVTNASRHRA